MNAIIVKGKRIRWIDATKGLLILLMVLGHIHNIAGHQGVQKDYLVKCLFFGSFYSCFFMQAFIILTGITSNFDKPLGKYFVSLVKTIVIPWFAFSVLLQIYRYSSGGGNLFVSINGQKFFFLFEDFWFLHVLFFGKLIYYFVYKYVNNDLFRAGILLLMIVLGFSIFSAYSDTDNTYHYYNYLHYKDLLCMTFFLWVGNYIKRHNIMERVKSKTLLCCLCLYLLGHAMRFFCRQNGIDETLIAPVVISHGGNAVSPLQIPAYIYYVILGSLTCLGIMQYIDKSGLLEYFGRNSLVIYGVHFLFLNIYVNIFNSIIPPSNIVNAMIYIVSIMIICLLSCTAVIILTKYKPFNYIVGKF